MAGADLNDTLQMGSTAVLGPALRAPPLLLLATEPLRGLCDLLASALVPRGRPVGDGHPVMVFPGLGATAFTTRRLRRHLDRSGFEAHDWGLGRNNGPQGPVDGWLADLVENVQRLQSSSGRRVSLVGWSLGGVYAREIAKLCPGAVRQVITLGTPVGSLARAHHARLLYRLLNGNKAPLTPELQARLRERPPVPTTAVYSRNDGVVNWQGCMEKASRRSQSIEVRASHLGMVAHPDVLRLVVDRLALPEDGWKPLRVKRPTS